MREMPCKVSIVQIQREISQAVAVASKIPSCADVVPILEKVLEQIDELAALLPKDE